MLSQLLTVLRNPPDELLKLIFLEAHEQHYSKEKGYDELKTASERYKKTYTKEHIAKRLLDDLETSDRFYNTMRKSERSVETSVFLSTTFIGSNLPYQLLRDQ